MSYAANIGVMGPKNSGRTKLITALKNSLSIDISFHELDFVIPEAQIRQMVKEHNLSILLLIVPESFHNTQASIIKVATSLKLKTAIVITKFDAALMNLDPFTQQFSSEQKSTLIKNEQNSIIKFLKNYNCISIVPIFHVSCLCFPMDVKTGFEDCCANENELCDFISDSYSPAIKNSRNFNNCILSPPNRLMITYETNDSNVGNDFLCTYDIVFVGNNTAFPAFVSKMMNNFFVGINYTTMECRESTDMKKQLANMEFLLAVIVINGDMDTSIVEALNYFKSTNVSFAVVINSENDNLASLKQTLGNFLPSNMIFAFNFEAISVENTEKNFFYQLIQEKTKKKLKQIVTKKRGISDNYFSSNILLLGLSEAFTTPLYETLKTEGHVKQVKYSSNPKCQEIISEIKAVEIAVIAIPVLFLDIYYPLFQELEDQNINYILILDITKSQQSKNFSIEPATNINIPLLSHVHCYNLSTSTGNNYQFIEEIRSVILKDKEKWPKFKSSTRL